MANKKVSVGLDIGVSSVGWSIVDIDKKEIVRAGVRLFEEAKTDKTTLKRSSRRLKNKNKNNLSKRDFFKLVIDNGFIKDNNEVYNFEFNNITMLELRNKALNEGVSKLELTVILLNYLKNISTFSLWDEASKENKSTNLSSTPYEKILSRIETDQEVYFVPSLFTCDQYIEELERIFNVQIQNNVCDENFKNDFFAIFNRIRYYSDVSAKASKNKISKWGLEKGDFIDHLVANDTYDNNERRAPKNCLTSYIFNALNDLNNIFMSSNIKATAEDKITLIKLLIEGEVDKKNNHKTYKVTLKRLKDFFNLDSESQIKGYRTSGKADDFNFTEFTAVSEIINRLKKANLDFKWINYDNYLNKNLDMVFEILTNCQTLKDRTETLKQNKDKLFYLTDEIIDCIAKVKLSGTHSLSIKTMKTLLEIMIKENKNHIQVLQVKDMKPNYGIKFQNHTNLKSTPLYKKIINEMFISDVIKSSLIESVKVVKEIEKFAIEQELEIEYLVIELAREKNDDENKEMIKYFQKRNEQKTMELVENYNIDKYISSKAKLKLHLYTEQNGKSIYSGEIIDVDRLVKEEKYCEIDHIIPFSFSIDDSMSNKVLCLGTENHNKTNRTPYGLLSASDYNNILKNIHEEYSDYLIKYYGKEYANKKIGNLLNYGSVRDIENMIKFISRNLIDTRYATNEVKNYFSFFRNKYKDELKGNFKIRTINRNFINFLRKEIFSTLEKKDRDQYKHQGIDATIIALSPLIKLSNTMSVVDFLKLASDYNKSPDNVINRIVDYEDFKKLNYEYRKIAININNYDFNFTRKVYKKIGIEISNDTIYSLKKDDDGKLYQIDKIDIFGLDDSTVKKLVDIFLYGYDSNVYIKKSDPKTFDYLKKIFKEFYRKTYNNKAIKNPFVYYRDELKSSINKKEKEDNRPLIKQLKIKNIIKASSIYDISSKFKNISKDKVVAVKKPKVIAWDCFYSKQLKKFAFLPIDVNVLKMDKSFTTKDINKYINKQNYESVKENLQINDTYEFKIRLFKYDTVNIVTNKEFEYNNFVIKGYFDFCLKSLEIKPINYKSEKRYRLCVNNIKSLKLISSNILKNKIKFVNATQ